MIPPEQLQIAEVDYGDGDIALLVELPIPPFGTAQFVTDDNGANARQMLSDLVTWWNSLWPEMLGMLQDGIKDFETEQRLGIDEFLGSVSQMDPECFMGDKSDIFLRLDFDDAPLWDYFLRDGKIAHFQPVF